MARSNMWKELMLNANGREIWFVRNKMKWNECRQPCARQRIGWNDITTIRINKSKVILGKHIKMNIYRKIIEAQTNWLNREKGWCRQAILPSSTKCLATNFEIASQHDIFRLNLILYFRCCSFLPVCQWLPDTFCYRRATKWLTISACLLSISSFHHIGSLFIVHLFTV